MNAREAATRQKQFRASPKFVQPFPILRRIVYSSYFDLVAGLFVLANGATSMCAYVSQHLGAGFGGVTRGVERGEPPLRIGAIYKHIGLTPPLVGASPGLLVSVWPAGGALGPFPPPPPSLTGPRFGQSPGFLKPM